MSVYAQEQHWRASRPEVGIHAGSTTRKAWSGPEQVPKRILSGHGGGRDAVRPRGFRLVETAQEAVNILAMVGYKNPAIATQSGHWLPQPCIAWNKINK